MEEAKKRKVEDEAHGAGEPVRKLKQQAHLARKELREAERLVRKVETGDLTYESLSHRAKQLVEDFNTKRLHVRVGRANVAYGHGIARTNDFGFQPGETMCRGVPTEVRAHLRTLQGS